MNEWSASTPSSDLTICGRHQQSSASDCTCGRLGTPDETIERASKIDPYVGDKNLGIRVGALCIMQCNLNYKSAPSDQGFVSLVA